MWFENIDGMGNFGPELTIDDEAGYIKDIHSVDLDGDGDYDIVAAAFYDDKISWYRNDYIEVDVEDNISDTSNPNNYSIRSIFPNPFNDQTTIQVSLPDPSELSVSIYNLAGQRIASLHEGQHSEGIHNFNFNGKNISTGIYFINVLVPGKMNEIKKIVLLK